MTNATNLNIVEFQAIDRPPDSPAKGVVLYFHGNRNNVEWYGRIAADFTRKGYEVLDDGIIRALARVPVSSASRNSTTYALVFYKMARSRWQAVEDHPVWPEHGDGDCSRTGRYPRLPPADPRIPLIIAWNHWAIIICRFIPGEGCCIIISPFTPIYRRSRRRSRSSTARTDRTFPYSNASRLKPILKPLDEFISVDGAGHNNLHDFPLFSKKLDSVLDQ